MRPTLFVALAVLAFPFGPAPAADDPSIDQLLAQLAGLRSKRAELDRQEAEAVAALRKKAEELGKKLADLGVHPPVGPNPPPRPPDPKPPDPKDPLAAALRAAFDKDPAADKRSQLADLAELYHQAADLAVAKGEMSSADLLKRIQGAAAALKITGLVEMRKLIAAEVADVFPFDVTLTDDQKAAARVLFTRIYTTLKGL